MQIRHQIITEILILIELTAGVQNRTANLNTVRLF